jgi:hypothetical protein
VVPFAPPPGTMVRLSLRISKSSSNRTEFERYRETCHLTIRDGRAKRWLIKRDRYGTRVEKGWLGAMLHQDAPGLAKVR